MVADVSELFSLHSHQSWCVGPTVTTSWKSSAQFHRGGPVPQDQRYTLGAVADRSLGHAPLSWNLLEGCVPSSPETVYISTTILWLFCFHFHRQLQFQQNSRTFNILLFVCMWHLTIVFRVLHLQGSCRSDVSTLLAQFACWQSPCGCNSTSRVQILLTCVTVLFKVCSL